MTRNKLAIVQFLASCASVPLLAVFTVNSLVLRFFDNNIIMVKSCIICKAEATHSCGRCREVWYCKKDHQISHWKEHKKECVVYKIEENPSLGRYLVARSTIKAGSVIMIDSPIALGPKQVTEPMCLSCFSDVDGSYSCKQCGWPLCGPKCQNSPTHLPECEMSRKRKQKIKVKDFGIVNPMYECITPLRCLWLKKKFPGRWQALMQMESHSEQRKEIDHIENRQRRTFQFIKEYLNHPEIPEQEIRHVCGVLDVNGFEIPGPGIVGLYPKASLLEHSCIPNVNRHFNSQLKLVIKAAVNISQGEHLTTSYTETLWNVQDRQFHLHSSKYFNCQCQRCESPTDLDTHLGSIKCTKCPNGLLPAPKNKETDWKCPACGVVETSSDMNKLLVTYGERLSQIGGDIAASEKFLKDTSRIFSENHSYRAEVKYGLAQIYGRGFPSDQLGFTEEAINKKFQFCQDILSIFDVLCPGKSGMRGVLLNEMQECCILRYAKLHKKFQQQEEGVELLEEAYQYAKEALEILPSDSHFQQEVQMYSQLQADFQKIRDLLQL